MLHPYVARREASTEHRLIAKQLSDGFGDGEEGLVGADVAEYFGDHDGARTLHHPRRALCVRAIGDYDLRIEEKRAEDLLLHLLDIENARNRTECQNRVFPDLAERAS